jgi:hypothetical protein
MLKRLPPLSITVFYHPETWCAGGDVGDGMTPVDPQCTLLDLTGVYRTLDIHLHCMLSGGSCV